MCPQTTTRETGVAPEEGGFGTLPNAVIGAIAGVVLSFVPLSTLLGGVVAGYLEGGEPVDGLRVGAIAGALMFFPVAFGATLLGLLLFGFGASAVLGLVGLVMLLFVALYTIGLGAVGGYLGVYLKHEL